MFQLMSGNYTLPLMGALLALSLTACDKSGTVPDEPNNPITKQETTESDYVTIVLEDDAGNDVLRALGEGSTNPQVGVYKYKDEFPEALAYMDLPGDKENNFTVSKKQLESKGVSIPVFANPNVLIAGGSWSPLPKQADPHPVTDVVIETFGKTGLLPTKMPFLIPPMPAPASKKIYVKLVANGLDRSVKPDFLLSGNITGEEIRVPYYTEKEYIFKGYRMVTTSSKKFSWFGAIMTGITPPLWAGLLFENYRDLLWLTTENTKKVPTYDVKGGYWMNYPVETGFVYNFEVQGQNGKPAPTSVTLDITYDEVSYKDSKVYDYILNPNGSEGTLFYDPSNYWWQTNYHYTPGPGKDHHHLRIGELTNYAIKVKHHIPQEDGLPQGDHGGKTDFYTPGFNGLYVYQSEVKLSRPIWTYGKTERVTLQLSKGKGIYNAYSVKFPNPNMGNIDPFYTIYDYGLYLPFDMTLKYIKDIKIVAPSGGAYVPLTKVDKNLLQ